MNEDLDNIHYSPLVKYQFAQLFEEINWNVSEYPEISEVTDGTAIKIPQNKLRDMISHVVF